MTDSPSKKPPRLDAFKDRLLEVTGSTAFGAILWSLLIAVIAFSLWHSPPNFDREISFVAKVYGAVLQLMGALEKLFALLEQQPAVVMVRSVLQHPVTIVSAILFFFFIWLAYEHLRLAIPSVEQSGGATVTTAARIRLFSHRLGLAVVGLLVVFPGTLLLLGDGFVLLPVVLIVPYVGIRILAWVIAALFE
jgi:hypothetical protein